MFNETPILALENDYVDDLDFLDFTFSSTRKSSFNVAITAPILAIGVPSVIGYVSYNLFPRRHSSWGNGQ